MCRRFDALSFAVALAIAGISITAIAAATAPKFGFGKPLTTTEIAGWDIDVRPDGVGLPAGRGTVAEGQVIYDEKCASCHGTFGESTDYMALAGGVGSLGSDAPFRTTGSKLNHATTLFDYIRRAMPFGNPKSLTNDEVYALTAYVLNLNDILPPDAALDSVSILAVRMPNRDGFTTDHGFMRKDGKPDTQNVACMRDCVTDVKLSSEMPDYARDSHGNLKLQTRPMGAVEGIDTAPANMAPNGVAAVAPTSGALAQKSGCTTCHAVSAKLIGPAWRDISLRYGPDPTAETRLAAKVREGGVGTWGTTPMPAQANVPDSDLHAILRWILGGAR